MEFWLIALYIIRFGNQKSYFLPKQYIFVFLWIAEQRAIISEYSIN